MLRYAVWAAVSTKSQAADDKVSLDVQIEKCHLYGRVNKWKHVRDYIVPGESRTKYISLYHAEKNIPQLHNMLEDAYNGMFDLLVVYDLDRFRNLMRQVFDALCDVNVQLYVLSDPRDPVKPEEYSEERKREMALVVDVRGIISDNQISNLQRHFRDKMPKRITEKGLHPGLGHPPYGYRKPPGHEYDRNAVLVQDPSQVRTLRQIKDWFLSGASLTDIAARLNRMQVPSPRGKMWWYSIISYLLANPYYAGQVGFGYTRTQRIRRYGIVTRRVSEPVTARGRHKAVWDQATHQRILAELDRRGQAHPGIKARALSRLLYCWCGSVLWAQVANGGETWRCSSRERGHINISNDDALSQVVEQVLYAVEHRADIDLPGPPDERPALQSELKDLYARKKRWMDLYENGKIEDPELLDRISELTAQIDRKKYLLRAAEQAQNDHADTREYLESLATAINELSDYLSNPDSPGEQVNADLRRLLKRANVDQDKKITLEWR